MATALLTRRFLAEYSRRPINLVLLAVVPLIFVMLAAGAIGDFAKIVGGVADAEQLAAPTAGWAAAFLAGVAGFFHVLGSREADRRLAAAGMGAGRIVAGRLASGLALALVAAGAAIGALALGTGISDPFRVIAGTVMFAVIYFAIGVTVGALTRSEVNGSLVVIFVWMFDVFLGPAMAGSDVWITRLFPTHFVTLVMLGTTSGHAGRPGDLGWAVAWTVGALVIAIAVFGATNANLRVRRSNRRRSAGGRWLRPGLKFGLRDYRRNIADLRVRRSSRLRWAGGRRLRAGLKFGLRDYRRNIAMWVLLVLVPILFITLSFYVTPDDPAPVELVEGGVASIQMVSMSDVHGAIMVPITIGFLAGLAGLFVVQGSLEADARLAVAGFRAREILASRLGVIALAALLTTAAALAVTAVDFTPANWVWFGIGNALVAVTYGMVGVLVGVLFGRLGGLYLMFLVPFIDIGIAQNIMFSAAPPSWGLILPGRGSVQVLVDAAFTPTFDRLGALVLAAVWIAALAAATTTVFRRIAEPRGA
jgi:hypothetical protein